MFVHEVELVADDAPDRRPADQLAEEVHLALAELRPEYAFASMKRGIRGKYAGCQQGAAAAEARCAPARSQAREEALG